MTKKKYVGNAFYVRGLIPADYLHGHRNSHYFRPPELLSFGVFYIFTNNYSRFASKSDKLLKNNRKVKGSKPDLDTVMFFFYSFMWFIFITANGCTILSLRELQVWSDNQNNYNYYQYITTFCIVIVFKL